MIFLQGITFTFGAATVDPGSSAYDPSPLKAYMQELGVEYHYEVQGNMNFVVKPSFQSL